MSAPLAARLAVLERNHAAAPRTPTAEPARVRALLERYCTAAPADRPAILAAYRQSQVGRPSPTAIAVDTGARERVLWRLDGLAARRSEMSNTMSNSLKTEGLESDQ